MLPQWLFDNNSGISIEYQAVRWIHSSVGSQTVTLMRCKKLLEIRYKRVYTQIVACNVARSQIEQNKVVFNCIPCSAEIMTRLCVCCDLCLSVFLSLFLSLPLPYIYFFFSHSFGQSRHVAQQEKNCCTETRPWIIKISVINELPDIMLMNNFKSNLSARLLLSVLSLYMHIKGGYHNNLNYDRGWREVVLIRCQSTPGLEPQHSASHVVALVLINFRITFALLT